MMGRRWPMAAMLIAIFLIAGFSMFMPRAGRISALTSYWTPQASYPTSDIGSFTNWPNNALPFQTSSWSQTYPSFSQYSLPTIYSGLLDYRSSNSSPVASQFRWGSSYPGFFPFSLAGPFGLMDPFGLMGPFGLVSPFGLMGPFGWPNISFSLPSYTGPSSYPTHPPFTWSSPSLWPPVVDGDTESQPPSTQEVEAEEYAVYSAYIAQSLYRKWERIRIRDHTTYTGSGSQNTTIEYLTERISEIVQDTIDDFFDRNQKSYPLGNYFDIDMAYELVDNTDPYEVLEFSRVGFNPTMAQALFEAGYMNGPAVGYGSYILMNKVNGVWSIQGGAAAWIS